MADRHVVFKQCLKEVAEQAGLLASRSWPSSPQDRAGSSCHIHLSLWRDGSNAFAGDYELRPGEVLGRLPLVPRRLDRARAGRDGVLRADGQLVQALRGRLVGADAARLELRQPHRRLPRRRRRTRACASSAASPAPTAIRTSRSPRRWPPGSTASQPDRAAASASAATSTRHDICRACPHTLRGRHRRVRRKRVREAAPSATRSSSTTPTSSGPRRPPSGSGHRLGAAAILRADLIDHGETARGQGGADHRRRQRHRPGSGAAVRRGGRGGRGRRRRRQGRTGDTVEADQGQPAAGQSYVHGRRLARRRLRADGRDGRNRRSAGSTCCSTTPASWTAATTTR